MFLAPSRKLAAHRLAHGGHRVYDPRERALLAAFDALLRLVSPFARLAPERVAVEPASARRILALRLDRLGDLITTLPALRCLRAAAPEARIELGVGSWNEPVARRLPFVDAVRVVDVPWSAWGKKVRLREARRSLDGEWDLALDFQGDVRVNLLMALTRAKLRGGYGETGGGHLLTHRAVWDEARSWYWQNVALVRTLFPHAELDSSGAFNFLVEEDRKEANKYLAGFRRPLIGIQPSAGRALKEWGAEKFAALTDRLAGVGTVILTGAASDRSLVERITAAAKTPPESLVGAPLLTFCAAIEACDVFVSGDTGPMHVAQAVGTPNVAIFGPSDPARYGPPEADDGLHGTGTGTGTGTGLRRVVRHPVFCSPCNMIRRPPKECAHAPPPECLAAIGVEPVLEAVLSCLNVRS